MGFIADLPFPASYLNINKIALYFQSKQCSGMPSFPSMIPGWYLSTQTIPSTISGGGSLTETFKDTCLAYFNSGGTTPTNQTTLDALATQFTLDWSNWKRATFDYVFNGVCNFLQNPLVDTYEWNYQDDKCDTRCYSYPLNTQIQELGHFDYGNDCLTLKDTGLPNFDGKPYIYLYGPPGICVNNCLQLAKWGLILTDGRLSEIFLNLDSFCATATATSTATGGG
jgi:hypothetical protein